MKDSEVLIAARGLIEDESEGFICIAIIAITEATKEQKVALCGWIQHMLGDYIYYSTWLQYNHPEIYKTVSTNDTRVARIQWLNWMIDYCEKEEAQ